MVGDILETSVIAGAEVLRKDEKRLLDELYLTRSKAEAFDDLLSSLRWINGKTDRTNFEIVHESGVEARDVMRRWMAKHGSKSHA